MGFLQSCELIYHQHYKKEKTMQQRFPLKPMCLLVLQALACHAYAADPPTQLPMTAICRRHGRSYATVEITGRGQSRQVQNINKADLAEALPGTSPLKVLENCRA
jgi:iron complex outermembrane receptor protein